MSGNKKKTGLVCMAVIALTGVMIWIGSGKMRAEGGTYNIQADPQKRITVGTISDQPYIKGGVRPLPRVKDGEMELNWGRDYVVGYRNNDKISANGKKAAVLIRGIGQYSGTVAIPFEVTAGSLSGRSIVMTAGDIAFQNKNNICRPVLEVIDHGYPLEAGTDYEKKIKYIYKDATDVGISRTDPSKTAQRAAGEEVQKEDIIPAGTTLIAAITGKGAYAGSVREAEFHVVAGD